MTAGRSDPTGESWGALGVGLGEVLGGLGAILGRHSERFNFRSIFFYRFRWIWGCSARPANLKPSGRSSRMKTQRKYVIKSQKKIHLSTPRISQSYDFPLFLCVFGILLDGQITSKTYAPNTPKIFEKSTSTLPKIHAKTSQNRAQDAPKSRF